MLVLAYVRRSKNSKKRPSASPERQSANIEEYCAAKGWTVEWFRDTEGHRSGLTELKRPAWLELKRRLETARPGEIAAVVVNSLDRSSRRAKDFLNFLDLLQSRRAEFASVTQPYLDTTTPYGRAMVANMMIFAQLEAEIDSQRLVEDIEYRQSEGQMWGPIPLGYSAAEKVEGSAYKVRQPDADAPLVVRLLEAYVNTDSGMKRLADEVNRWPADHLPGGFWRMRRRDGSRAPFTFRSIESILDNVAIYAGRVPRYAGREGEEVYAGKHEAIIGEELAERVQEARARRRNKDLTSGRLPRARLYLLTGLLRCATCGAKLRGQMLKGRARYWHEKGSHGWARVDAEQIEAAVLDRLRGWRMGPELARQVVAALSRRPYDQAGSDGERQIAMLRAQLEREKDLYSLGDRSREEYVRRRAEIDQQITRLTPRGGAPPNGHLAASLAGVQDLLNDPASPRPLVKTALATMIESVETDGQGIAALNFHPWYRELFHAVIDLYPQPAFSRQIGLALERSTASAVSVRGRCKERNAEIASLRADGWTYRRLAERYGISIARVEQVVKDRS